MAENISLETLGKLMVEHNLAIRAVPMVVRDIVEVRHKDEYPDGVIKYLPEFKREMLVTLRTPKHAGMFVVEKASGTASTVHFGHKKFYRSLEDIVKEYQEKEDKQ